MKPYVSYAFLANDYRVRALLDVIARGEVDPDLSLDDQYRQQVGGKLLGDLDGHPRTVVYLPSIRVRSTAAGRYQFLSRTWADAARALELPDFGPEAQDAAAVFLIERRGVLNLVLTDDPLDHLDAILDALAPEWASLPTRSNASYYGQPCPYTRTNIRHYYRERLAVHRGNKRVEEDDLPPALSGAPIEPIEPLPPDDL